MFTAAKTFPSSNICPVKHMWMIRYELRYDTLLSVHISSTKHTQGKLYVMARLFTLLPCRLQR